MAIPAQIVLPPGPLASPARPSVTVRGTGAHVLVVSNATVNVEGVALDLKETQPGRAYTLTLQAPAGLQLPSTQRVEISLESNHPKFPVIKVPVTQLQARATSTGRAPSSPTPSSVAWPVSVPAAK